MQIETHGLTKKYGRVSALEEVSLSIGPGQIVGVLGANGAGKTTLLRCLAGLVAPDRGDVRYDGRRFHRGLIDVRRRICFLPDFPVVHGNVTLLRHLGMMLRLYERPLDGTAEEAVTVLKELDLLALADTPLHKLSRGQLYKSTLAGLLMVAPELWILDEPFASGMDPQGISYLRKRAGNARERGHTIIFTTQILEIAERLADRVCLLQGGRVRMWGSISELSEKVVGGEGVLEEALRALREGEL
jgi:ABC-type multidrug transport system ATPase subunit